MQLNIPPSPTLAMRKRRQNPSHRPERPASPAHDSLRRTNIQVFHIPREADDDSAIDTEERARHVPRVLNVHVADRLGHVRGCPGLCRGHGDGPVVRGGVDQCDCDRWVGLLAGFEWLSSW